MIRVAILWFCLAVPALACEMPGDAVTLRQALLSAVNAQRVGQGLAGLGADPRLDTAAQDQACRMADRETLTHRGRWFAGLGRRLRRVDYPYALAVENIGAGQDTVAQIVAGWMASDEHRANILTPDLQDAGFGAARAEDGRIHWSMIGAALR